jgi:hypothetical protein
MKIFFAELFKKSSINTKKEEVTQIPSLESHWKFPEISLLSHFKAENATQVIYQDQKGNTFIEKVSSVARKKEFIGKLSPNDAYLLGYLLGCEEEELYLDYAEGE